LRPSTPSSASPTLIESGRSRRFSGAHGFVLPSPNLVRERLLGGWNLETGSLRQLWMTWQS
jgi:hypothetical protein